MRLVYGSYKHVPWVTQASGNFMGSGDTFVLLRSKRPSLNSLITLLKREAGEPVWFSAHLGHPGALLQPFPPPPACPPSHPTSGQRYRGPSDKQRSRVRAANREAAAKAAAPPETPVPTSSTSAVPAASSSTAEPVKTSTLGPPLVPVMPVEPEKPAAGASKVTIDKTAKTETATTAVPECEKTDILCEVASTSCKAGVTCWNCDNLMEPDHQCEESSSCSPGTVSGVNETTFSVKTGVSILCY